MLSLSNGTLAEFNAHGSLVHRYKVDEQSVVCESSYHSSSLVTGSDFGIIIWERSNDHAERKSLYEIEGVAALADLNDRRHIIRANENGMMCVWDLEEGQLVHSQQAAKIGLMAVCLTRDGYVWSASFDGNLIKWSLKNLSLGPREGYEEVVSIKRGHEFPIYNVLEMRSGRIASSGQDLTVCNWNEVTGVSQQDQYQTLQLRHV